MIAEVILSVKPDLVALQEAAVPVNQPTMQIDFILYRPANRWKVVEVKVLDEAVASDHCAIVAVLELLPNKE